MTIAERFSLTTGRTARLMLQDKAVTWGAQHPITPEFERVLQATEAQDKELHYDTCEPPTTQRYGTHYFSPGM